MSLLYLSYLCHCNIEQTADKTVRRLACWFFQNREGFCGDQHNEQVYMCNVKIISIVINIIRL